MQRPGFLPQLHGTAHERGRGESGGSCPAGTGAHPTMGPDTAVSSALPPRFRPQSSGPCAAPFHRHGQRLVSTASPRQQDRLGHGHPAPDASSASSDLRLNPHFHTLFLDGVYVPPQKSEALDATPPTPFFQAAPKPTQEDIECVGIRRSPLHPLAHRFLEAAWATGSRCCGGPDPGGLVRRWCALIAAAGFG